MYINLEMDTSPQFYYFLIINAKKYFDGHSLMVELKCFNGSEIMDVILPKYVGDLIPEDLINKIQRYHLIVCINKQVGNIRNVIMITNDTPQLIPSGEKYRMRVSLCIEGEKLESSYPLPFVRNQTTHRKNKTRLITIL